MLYIHAADAAVVFFFLIQSQVECGNCLEKFKRNISFVIVQLYKTSSISVPSASPSLVNKDP